MVKGNLVLFAAMFSVSLVLLRLVDLAVNVLTNLLSTDQRRKLDQLELSETFDLKDLAFEQIVCAPELLGTL